ncbi:PREDICTED: collagenase-like [Papilio polytes]|uniref:collagenase-like n=1 Tax=Papilio polytes TaxID=76194 RepID=UPI0006765655|nr:PREDICTED: collagenase-like [Papilio polytes]
MYIKFALLCFSIVQCTWGYHKLVGIPRARAIRVAEGSTRIVGGSQVTTLNSFSYQAGIVVTLTTGAQSICGGSIVSTTRVLTAAHCWRDGQMQARKFTIVLGSLRIFSGGTRVDTTDVVVHPQWNFNDITNDIAMVKMAGVTLNANIQPIALPTTSEANDHFAGQAGIASGYGKTRDSQNSFPSTTALYQVTLSVLTNAQCQQRFDMRLHSSHLCTDGVRGVGTCEGDSGGPLTIVWKNRRILIGIVSFGLGDGCQLGLPSVYTRVTSFLPWINSNM